MSLSYGPALDTMVVGVSDVHVSSLHMDVRRGCQFFFPMALPISKTDAPPQGKTRLISSAIYGLEGFATRAAPCAK